MRAGAREGTLTGIVSVGDEIGGRDVVDATLVELCGDPGVADEVFRMTRDRLSRRGPDTWTLLADAHARALIAAPNAISVQDYARYLKLLATPAEDASEQELAALAVDPEETGRAVAAAPADPAVRATHALALLKAGRPQEALGAFDDLTVFFSRVPPGLQAALCRVLVDGGRREMAAQASEKVDRKHLTPEELRMFEGKP